MSNAIAQEEIPSGVVAQPPVIIPRENRVLFTPLPDNYIPPPQQLNSKESPEPIEIPMVSPPPTAFVWPESSHQFVHSLYDLGFERLTLPYNPFFFITGNNHHYGREQVEVYSYRLPGHPTDPCDTNPNLVGLFPPTVTVPSRNGDGSTEEVPNPALLAAGLPRETDAAVVVGLLHLGIFATGPPGYGHGGMLASIADVVQFLAYAQTGRRAVTGQLNMTYRSPVPLGHVHVFVASVELTGERKGNTRFTILSQDLKTIHLESTAVFITPRSALGASLKQTAKDYENAYQKS